MYNHKGLGKRDLKVCVCVHAHACACMRPDSMLLSVLSNGQSTGPGF